MSLEAAAASSIASASATLMNGNMRPPSASPTPRFNSGSFLSVAGCARGSSGAQTGAATAAAAAAGVFGANAGKGGLFSSLSQILGGSLR
jgi:hypothetical protein